MANDLKSLKNPTRLLTAFMFLSFIIYSIGETQLAAMLPNAPTWVITVLVGIATYVVTQYGTELRVVRAEDLKEDEIINDTE